MNTELFRKKTIERISSPEQLNDFIKVARPSVWMVMAAIVILLVGAVVWACVSTIEISEINGKTETIHPIEFVVN